MGTLLFKEPASFPRIDQKEGIFHLLFWLLLIASAIIGNSSWTRIFPDYGVAFIIITLAIPFYTNALVLIPRYFNRSKWVKYVLLLSALLLAVNSLKALFLILSMQLAGMEYDFYAEFPRWFFRDFRELHKFLLSASFLLVFFSFAYRIVKDWVISERVKDRLIAEKLSAELALLKSQLNPHFLFNTLNNIYAIALEEKAERTAESVAKMGSLMRYSLHDAQEDLIPLEKEITYIEKYIALQKIRIGAPEHVNVHVQLGTMQATAEKIAPMILLPLIENAFKWGVSTVSPSLIKIELKLEKGVLKLLVENTVHAKNTVEQGGIGLKNMQDRLRLLYPQRHRFVCTKSQDRYTVELELNLKEGLTPLLLTMSHGRLK